MENKDNFYKRLLNLSIGIILNGFAVTLFVMSNLGTSTVSSIPYIVSKIMGINFGGMLISFQVLLIGILILIRRFKMTDLYSVIVGICFGTIVDVWTYILKNIGIDTLFPMILLITGILLLPLGITLTIESNLCAIPFDLFVKDIASLTKVKISKVKTIFDISCIIITLTLSFVFLGKNLGIGIGTIISTLITGKLIGFYTQILHKKG